MSLIDHCKKVIIFSPHPDDETIGCGGIIAKKKKEGYAVFIVVLTDGRNGLNYADNKRMKDIISKKELIQIRKNELFKSVKILGLNDENIIFLDFEDGSLLNYQKIAETKIREILNRLSPSEIYFTYEKDVNPDHVATYFIIKNALKNTNHSMKLFKYSITQKFSNIGPIVDNILNIFKNNLEYIDISDYLVIKEKAINQYESQININLISSNRLIKRHLKKYEVYYLEKK